MSLPAGGWEIHPMTLMDLDGVMEVEHTSFAVPWSRDSFEKELLQNTYARYFVARDQGRVAAYAGCWIVLDEAHVTNVAVHPDYRGQHLGEVMMYRLMRGAVEFGGERMTLEVRTSNRVAQNLYKKLGFVVRGVRPGYYSDNAEDALIMWQDDLPGFLAAHEGEGMP